MNRIKLRPLAQLGLNANAPVSIQEKPDFPKPVFSQDDSANLLDYSLFIPQHYEVKYAYPLVVWLHSDDADQSQLMKMMPQLSTRNYAAVSVSSVDESPQTSKGFETGSEASWNQSSFSIDQTAQQLQVAIDHAKLRLNIDDRRVFIAGSGRGGTMAMRMAFSFPSWFAGAASLNGAIPENLRPLSNWQACRDIPVFWAHARRSNCFSESDLCQQLRLLHIAGFSVVLKQYPCDDQLDPKVYSDMNSWIMETIAENSGSDSIIR